MKRYLLFFYLILFGVSDAQSQSSVLYGQIITIDDDVYEGQLRWGTEEAYWTDLFNGSKVTIENSKYLSPELRAEVIDRRGGRFSTDISTAHVFSVQFGYIDAIIPERKNEVLVQLRDGTTMQVKGGSNDIGADVHVYDPKIGEISVEWDRIARVQFTEAPKNYQPYFGIPIIGSVKTRDGEVSGYIQWDKQERLSKDKIDGESKDGELSIPMGNIAVMEKYRRGLKVKFHSGREIELDGTNDVDRRNRGIVVTSIKEGRVEIPWRQFERAVLQHNISTEMSREDFKTYGMIYGKVFDRSGQTFEGKIVFDLDEQFDFEMLDGYVGEIEYKIPFALIQEIVPLGFDRAQVTLTSGEVLRLEDTQDVTDQNDGIIIDSGKGRPAYVSWRDVDRIEFSQQAAN